MAKNKKAPPPRKPRPSDSFTPEQITDISVEVYKLRLNDPSGGGPGAVARMLKKDADDGKKLRGRAKSYDRLTKAYINSLTKLGFME